MILRVFTARIRPGKFEEYDRLVRERAIPMVRRRDGLVTMYAGTPIADDDSPRELVIVSVWQDMAALKAFAGEDCEQAVILPGEEELLDGVSVRNYETFA